MNIHIELFDMGMKMLNEKKTQVNQTSPVGNMKKRKKSYEALVRRFIAFSVANGTEALAPIAVKKMPRDIFTERR